VLISMPDDSLLITGDEDLRRIIENNPKKLLAYFRRGGERVYVVVQFKVFGMEDGHPQKLVALGEMG